jgi:hypothetical protein
LRSAQRCPAALADGDPASDVLAQQSLFLPQDAGIPARQQAQLEAIVQAAARSGYQIRVALIDSAADLGSVTELFGQPQAYAAFLGQELALVYHGRLLVVMPHGLGLYPSNRALATERTALAGLPSPAAVGGLGTVALSAIQRVAGVAGHPLTISKPAAQAKPAKSDVLAWVAFAGGGILIALAWTARLRARPFHLREKPTSS